MANEKQHSSAETDDVNDDGAVVDYVCRDFITIHNAFD